MGVGKTSVGTLLARRLGAPYRFVDLDAAIEQGEELSGKSITDYFKSHGEAAFRVVERRALHEPVGYEEAACVHVSCGAGQQRDDEPHAHERQLCDTPFLLVCLGR